TRPPRTRCSSVGTAMKTETRSVASRAIRTTSSNVLPAAAASAAARTTRPRPTDALRLLTCSNFVFSIGGDPTIAAWYVPDTALERCTDTIEAACEATYR